MTASKPHVLIVGAKSDIAHSLAHIMAREGHGLQLAARDTGALETVKTDLELRYRIPVQLITMDVAETAGLQDQLTALEPAPHIIVSMVGWMGDQTSQQGNPDEVTQVITANFTGPAALMEAGAKLFETIDAPTTLVGVSSVAGDRGRARNYYYGAAKSGFTAVMSGLRQRLVKTQTTVITVKPGFVATRTTDGMDLPKPLVDSADDCAAMIAKAIAKKREVVYPLKWRIIMTVLKLIPESIFKRLKF